MADVENGKRMMDAMASGQGVSGPVEDLLAAFAAQNPQAARVQEYLLARGIPPVVADPIYAMVAMFESSCEDSPTLKAIIDGIDMNEGTYTYR